MQENTTTPAVPQEELIPVPEPSSIAFADTDISKRYDDVYEVRTPDEITSVRWNAGAYEFACKNGVALRIQLITRQMVRFRYTPDGIWERDFSYALSPDFQPEKLTVTLNETANEYVLASESLQVVVTKTGMKIRIFDLDDQLLHEDYEGYSAQRTIMQGWNRVSVTKTCNKKALFYGLGDKSSLGANLHGKKYDNWCTDSYAFGTDTDPLYRAIPFYYGVQSGIAHGVFFDNTFRTSFDFNSTDNGVVEMAAEGGELNYYFIYGPQLNDVAVRYHQLTGAHELPPMWALGYHQCRWSYYPEAQVKALAETFRRMRIPCDAIYLDIDYMDGYRCFTWERNHFPDPKRMIAELKEMGFHTVVMIDPGIKEDPLYFVYKEGMERGFFVKTVDGQVAKAPVWPGFCAFPDFTNPEVRQWWGDLYSDLYKEDGVSGFWNDMNEPAVFYVNRKTLPDMVLHHYDGDPCSHKKAHNIYGQLMTRSSYEGYQRLQPQKRPYLLTRATYSGGQRYAAVWTGDNCASWEHLQIANIQCQRLAISGFSFCGTDIGGFAGEPDGELYIRWLQLAVFHPLMRTHSIGNHVSGDAIYNTEDTDEHTELLPDDIHQFGQEPWSYGEKWTQVARTAIELRYCMLPVIYTAFWKLKTAGVPVIRHLAFEDQTDSKLWDQDRDFIFGDHLLVSPVVQTKVQRQMVYLPAGNWYYFWTGQQCNGEVFVNTAADQIPFFVREGAVMVTYPIRQTTAAPVEEITLYCYYKNGSETSSLYEDEGEGMGYLTDKYALSTFVSEGDAEKYTLNWLKTGQWKTENRKIKIYLIGFPTFARRCLVDGVEKPVKEIRLRERSLYTLIVETDFSTISWQI